MKYNPDIYHRRSIRLREYDYTSSGAYFVTICTHGRECQFGRINNGEILLNDAGRMVESVWCELATNYPGVAVGAHVVMPNHFHGIIILDVGAGPRACPDLTGPCACPDLTGPYGGEEQGGEDTGHPQGGEDTGHPQGGAPTMSLPDVVHRFKSLTTTRYRYGVEQSDWPSFPGRLWQRNCFERVIRDENELAGIREYIQQNPLKWADDENNPNAT